MKKLENVSFYYNRLLNIKMFLNNIDDLQEAIEEYTDKAIVVNKRWDGDLLPDKDWLLIDASGKILMTGRENIEAETGTIPLENGTATLVVKPFTECDEEEKELIRKDMEDYE